MANEDVSTNVESVGSHSRGIHHLPNVPEDACEPRIAETPIVDKPVCDVARP